MGAAMTDRELMQQALDALTQANQYIFTNAKLPFPPALNATSKAAEALRDRLAQPEQKPVAQVRVAEDYHAHVFWMVGPLKFDQRYLYAAPRSWQGLTDEEIRGFEIWLDDEEEKHGWNPPADIVKYIEAKLKEKNG